MKNKFACTIVSFLLFVGMQVAAQNAVTDWSKNATKKWFNKKEWLNGAQLKPHPSINKKEFARQYHLNKLYWDKAFTFLKQHNLDSLPKGKYPIDGDNVTASVTEDPTKDFENTGWESHRKFIDVQCIISGEEKMGVYPITESVVIKEYDDKKDVANYTTPGKFYIAGPGMFFIFFPSDAHRPNITPGGNKLVKKIVIKVRAAG
ncbi:MAG: YhcH/YjgK/YiaL family protein [Ferruginibacter sp.]|nr:YhcH/YjgK/YiaL family protein [Ferruginibacter sp.]